MGQARHKVPDGWNLENPNHRRSRKENVRDRCWRGVRRVPVKPAALAPDEIVYPQLDEAIMNLVVVAGSKVLHEPLNLGIALPLRIAAARVIEILDVAEPLDVHHAGSEKRPDQQLVIVADVHLRVVSPARGITPAESTLAGGWARRRCDESSWH